jgi:uncharacterized protein YqjF (DUF2071 family)
MAVRPRRRPWHAATALDDFAIITYLVDPVRLASLLPAAWEPITVPSNGGRRAMVSAVPFRDRRFHYLGFPFITLSCGQVNYRTYVRHGDQIGVWFFGTSLDSRLVIVPRRLWSMPWHRGAMDLRAQWQGEVCANWSLTVAGRWGTARAQLRDARRAADFSWLGDVDPSTLVDPTVGWYRRLDGRIGRYSVWHRPLAPLDAELGSAHFEVFDDLGLTDVDQQPVSAVVQQTVAFDVHTPPHRVRLEGADRSRGDRVRRGR